MDLNASLILFFITVLVCEIIGTISGFGASVFLVPLAGLFFDFKTALALTGIIFIFSSLTKIYLFRKDIKWSLVLKIGIPSIAFTLLGAYLNNKTQSRIAELAMGIFLVSFAIIFLLKQELKFKPTNLNAISGGIASGFFTGFIGTGGAIRGAALSAFDLQKEIFTATSACIDLGGDIGRTFIYIFNGYLDRKYLWFIPVLIVLAFSGSYIGKKILKQIPQNGFKNFVLVFILIIGAVMITGYFLNKSIIS